MKQCFKCKELKCPADFAMDNQKWDRLRPQCRACEKEGRKPRHKLTEDEVIARRLRSRNHRSNWRNKNPELYHISRRNAQYKKKYGITYAQFIEFCENLDYKCPLCQTTLRIEGYNGPNKAVVDHCHRTNKFRSVLCHFCNAGLGYMKESIETLKNAINYLEAHSCVP